MFVLIKAVGFALADEIISYLEENPDVGTGDAIEWIMTEEGLMTEEGEVTPIYLQGQERRGGID